MEKEIEKLAEYKAYIEACERNQKEQALLQIGRLKAMEDGKGFEFVFKEPYNDQFNNIMFNYTDEERAIRFLYNYLKSKNII